MFLLTHNLRWFQGNTERNWLIDWGYKTNFRFDLCEIPIFDSCDQICAWAIDALIVDIFLGVDIEVYHASILYLPLNLSKYIDPHMHARFPLMTTIVDEFTAKKIPVPPPHSNAWLTVSQTGTLFALVVRQQVSFRQTIVPHIKQTVGSLGIRSHLLHFRLW